MGPGQMRGNKMWVYVMAAAALVGKVCNDLVSDSSIRETTYTQPLATMPDNVKALADEMIAEATKSTQMTADQLLAVEKDIYRMMSEGAVAQRNHAMEQTREQISYCGYFLSWFMKQKGLTYTQIQAKYALEFSQDERLGHKKIIESASRTNKNLQDKFVTALVGKFSGA